MSEESKSGEPIEDAANTGGEQSAPAKERKTDAPRSDLAFENTPNIQPAEINASQPKRGEAEWIERWMPYCEIVGIVVGIIVGLVICGQYWEMIKTNREMRIALITDNRAWVAPFEMAVITNSSDTNWVRFKMVFKNTGRTPAINVSEFHADGFLAQVTKTNAAAVAGSMMLAPDGTTFILSRPYYSRVFDDATENPACVYGRINYDDIFRNHHWTDFCWSIEKGYAFRPATTHNSCDDANQEKR